MHKRTAHRWRLTLILMIAIGFALGSFWLVQVMHNGEVSPVDMRRNDPDYIVENFSFVRMTPQGQPRYIISGTKLTHRPLDDASDIEQPVVQSLSADNPPMTIHSRHARIDHDNSQLHLLGDVDIERAGSPKAEALALKTDALTVLPDEDQMETDQPLDMTLGTTKLTGVGMKANNATGQIDIKNKMKLFYPPR